MDRTVTARGNLNLKLADQALEISRLGGQIDRLRAEKAHLARDNERLRYALAHQTNVLRAQQLVNQFALEDYRDRQRQAEAAADMPEPVLGPDGTSPF